jgi:hypothetical protein
MDTIEGHLFVISYTTCFQGKYDFPESCYYWNVSPDEVPVHPGCCSRGPRGPQGPSGSTLESNVKDQPLKRYFVSKWISEYPAIWIWVKPLENTIESYKNLLETFSYRYYDPGIVIKIKPYIEYPDGTFDFNKTFKLILKCHEGTKLFQEVHKYLSDKPRMYAL